MAIVGSDFPKTKDARKKLLNEILRDSKPISTTKVPGYNYVNVYQIPLDYLSYNPYNTRFIAQAQTIEKSLGRKLNNENPEDIKYIEKFIWEEKKDKNENTINSLVKDGQLEPGVVTNDGLILAGNRRFRLLNEISRNKSKYKDYNIDSLNYFEAAILTAPQFTEKEIVEFESKFQYGSEEKVGYSAIQKYIAAYHQKIDLGFDVEKIASNFMALTNGKKKIVEEWIDVFKLMNEYLDYIKEPGIYTALESREEAFLKLRGNLKSLDTGKLGREIWNVDQTDIADYKMRIFDYIF